MVINQMTWTVVNGLLLVGLIFNSLFPAQQELTAPNPDSSIQTQYAKSRALPPDTFMTRFLVVKLAYEQCAGDFSFEEQRCQEMKTELLNLVSPQA